ncbi:MAG: phosphatase PAP2 family protein, partial [Chitinophagaceae bacterium]|nr:phosphatase PAP2 family protein [Rubrivivax sp.]
MRRHFGFKAAGISLFMWAFFVGYFHVLRHPVYPVFQMPMTALDHAIPFQPAGLAAYVSLWLYVGVPPGLLWTLRELVVYGVWAGALCLTGLAFFYFLPTAVPPLSLDIDLTQHAGFAVLQGVDASGNACPSLHVATATFSAIWIAHLLRGMQAPRTLGAISLLWLALIVWSTLAIKQHVALDALAGAALGALFAAASLRWRTEAAARMRRHFGFKAAGISLFMWAFFVGY